MSQYERMTSLLIRNGDLVTGHGLERQDILIEDGIITTITSPKSPAPRSTLHAPRTIDASGFLIFPGLIDCHVHFREPGMTEAEDMESGARSARSGGVTTVCDMPNTNPPTCTRQAFEEKVRRAERVTHCDIRFFFGMTRQEHLRGLEAVLADGGLRPKLCGVKLYFGHSTGNQKVGDDVLKDIFRFCAEHDLPLVCHCEDEGVVQKNLAQTCRGTMHCAPTDVHAHSHIRSVEAAVAATSRAIALAKKFRTSLHIAHVSTGDELVLIRRAKEQHLPITCEVAPHHLFLTIEDYESLGTLAKVNPPIRSSEHVEALWQGIADGTVDCIASDHAPHTLEAKGMLSSSAAHPLDVRRPRSAQSRTLEESAASRGAPANVLETPSGVPGAETMLPLLLSCVFADGPMDADGNVRHAGAQHGSTEPALSSSKGSPQIAAPLQIAQVLRLLFTRPNEIFRLGKAGIALGKETNLILVDPQAKRAISGKTLKSKCGWTPYEGWRVQGAVIDIAKLSSGTIGA